MLTIIKTGIVTIILSFISGVLLDRYKNVAPRIVCSMSKGVTKKINGEDKKIYIIDIKNVSKKTIHNLNLNLQACCGNITADNAKITKGLKFDMLNEEGSYDISIPFLSKDDKFSVNVVVDDLKETENKPIASLRSPEKFKKIDSKNLFDNKYESKNDSLSRKQRNSYKGMRATKNKKAVIAGVSILLLMFLGILSVVHHVKAGRNLGTSNNNIPSQTTESSQNNSDIQSNEKSKSSGKSGSSTQNTQSSGTSSTSEKEKNSSSVSNNNKDTSKDKKDTNSNVNNSQSNSKENSDKNSSSNEKNTGNSNESSKGSSAGDTKPQEQNK